MGLINKGVKKNVAEQAVETEATKVETEQVVEQAVETGTTKVEAKQAVETEQVAEQVTETTKVETEQVAQTADTEQVVEAEQDVVSDTSTQVQPRAETGVAVQAKAMPSRNQVLAEAADEGFDGLDLGLGSFPIITLPSEGVFNDSDDNDLGKHIRVTIQESRASFLYKQEGVEKGDVAFSYDQVNITGYTGSEEFKTVSELRSAWLEEGYEVEEKKYVEVIAMVAEDIEDVVENCPDALLDLAGEPVILRVAPGSAKALAGKVYTLKQQGKQLRGTLMDVKVGAKRKNGGNSYYPWKFVIAK